MNPNLFKLILRMACGLVVLEIARAAVCHIRARAISYSCLTCCFGRFVYSYIYLNNVMIKLKYYMFSTVVRIFSALLDNCSLLSYFVLLFLLCIDIPTLHIRVNRCVDIRGFPPFLIWEIILF